MRLISTENDSHGEHSSSGPQATNATRVLEQDQTFDTTGVLYNTTESFAFRQNRLKIKTLATEMGYLKKSRVGRDMNCRARSE
jgi:hypothetical protein